MAVHIFLCYTQLVKTPQKKNLTLSLPADLIQAAKVFAARRGTSINALVKESLGRMVRQEDEYAAALRRILAASEKPLYRTRRKVPRAKLYDRSSVF